MSFFTSAGGIAETQTLNARLRLDSTQFISALGQVSTSLGLFQAKSATMFAKAAALQQAALQKTALAGAATGGPIKAQLERESAALAAQSAIIAQRAAAFKQLESGAVGLAKGGLQVLTRGFLLMAGAAVYLGNKAITIEDAFAGVKRTLADDATPQKLAEIRKGLLELSLQLPITQQDIMGIAEVAGTAGVAADDIVKFTGSIARLAKITDLSVAEITPSVAKLMKVMGIGVGEIDNFFSGLAQASIILPSTDQEMILAAERFAAFGKQVGFGRDQIIALAAVATTFGQRPEAAGTAVLLVMQRAVRNIAEGGDRLKLFAKISGETAAQVKAQWRPQAQGGDPFGGLIAFLEGYKKLDAGQQAIVAKQLGFSTARIGQLLANLALNTDLLREVEGKVTNADKTGTLFFNLSEQRFNTLKNHLQELWNTVTDLSVAFGEGLGIDTASGALDRFIDKVKLFLSTHRQDFVNFGRDVGRWLDKIDFKSLAEAAGGFFGIVKGASDLIMALPDGVRNIGLEFIALNKLSGGLFGGAVTGIAGGIAGLIRNKFIPQNVVVVAFSPAAMAQMAASGGGGLLGDLAAGGGLALAGLTAIVAAVVALLVKSDQPHVGAGSEIAVDPQGFANWLATRPGQEMVQLISGEQVTVSEALRRLAEDGIKPLGSAARDAANSLTDVGTGMHELKNKIDALNFPGRRDPLTDPTRPPGKGWTWSASAHKWVQEKPPATTTSGGAGSGAQLTPAQQLQFLKDHGLSTLGFEPPEWIRGRDTLDDIKTGINSLVRKLPTHITFRSPIITTIVNVSIGARAVVSSVTRTNAYGPIYYPGSGLGPGVQ